MKLIKIICLGVLVSFFTVSCKEASKSGNEGVAKTSQSENLKKIEIGIEGMTCQIGCAKTIESKLSKKEGISSIAISFEDKLGQIVYDANKISKEDITKQITAIAGGETYRVISVKEMPNSCCAADLKVCTKKCSAACTKTDCAKCAAAQADCKIKCTAKGVACCAADLKSCTMKCSATCTKADCTACAALQADCKTKCTAKGVACCTADLKSCTMKCSATCTKADCDTCAAVQADCKTKCAVEKQACCLPKK
jgi:copper chaperone CopZ